MRTVAADINKDSRADFRNYSDYCVGTGRMDLALMDEYLKELDMVQEECAFRHIRGHGLFSERMGIYRRITDRDGRVHDSCCFTYLDRVMDAYLARGLEPFIELGFMPKQIASDKNTVFWWDGNITPPENPDKWAWLVKTTLTHLLERYGDRVLSWPVEVWNEPNLVNFWKDADKPAYFELYRVTVKAVKEVSPMFRVGGPAICGGDGSLEWVRDFLSFCRDEKLPVDFVTRHAYMGETPHREGQYMYHTMCSVDDAMIPLTDTREIIDSFPEYKGMEMHVTEFNTSYNSRCPIHDTNLNAAIIAHWLSKLGDVSASYSYWTFGDVFEEEGIPSIPFHGGFGMVAGGCIAKPTLWSFAFMNRLKGAPVFRNENCVITRRADGSLEGVAWNDGEEEVALVLGTGFEGSGVMELSSVSPSLSNPLKCWHEMGEPASLTKAQERFLRDAGRPVNTTRRFEKGEHINIVLEPASVVYFSVRETEIVSDYGYDYSWYQKG